MKQAYLDGIGQPPLPHVFKEVLERYSFWDTAQYYGSVLYDDIGSPDPIRTYVRNRDKHQCQECGSSCTSAPCYVHHIIPRSNIYCTHDPWNLVLLCRECHTKVHRLSEDALLNISLKYLAHGLRLRRQKARKRYVCEACGCIIEPRDEYYYGRYGWKDDIMLGWSNTITVRICFKSLEEWLRKRLFFKPLYFPT